MEDGLVADAGVAGNGAGRAQPFESLLVEIGIFSVFAEHLLHAFEYPGVDLAVIARPAHFHLSVDRFDVYEVAGDIEFLYLPYPAGQSKSVSHRRGRGYNADLAGFTSYGKVFRILENCIEFERVYEFFAPQPYYELTVLCELQPVVIYHRHEKELVVLPVHKGERGKVQDYICKSGRGQSAA